MIRELPAGDRQGTVLILLWSFYIWAASLLFWALR